MTTTYVDAKNSIFTLIKSTWETEALTVVNYVPEIRWPNVEYSGSPDVRKHWIRVSIATVDEKQAALRSTVNGIQLTRYSTHGIIIVQLFGSKQTHKGNDLDRLSVIVRNMFRGNLADDKVWFRNSKITEIAPEEVWFRNNVSADYVFDEIK